MHCPYCGSLNSDRATYCIRCGRDLQKEPAQGQGNPPQAPTSGTRQTSYSPARQTPPPAQNPYQQAYPTARPVPPPTGQQQQRPQPQPQGQPGQPGQSRPQSQTQRPVQPQVQPQAAAPSARPAPSQPIAPPVPLAPEPPALFPSRTVGQLRALEPGAQAYTVVDSFISNGKKKIVRIAYQRCTGWQQAATLLKAWKEQQEDRFDSIVIQGVFSQFPDVYAFTNGQLSFDRNVLLGSQKLTRYILETGNGFESDSVRIVLTEP